MHAPYLCFDAVFLLFMPRPSRNKQNSLAVQTRADLGAISPVNGIANPNFHRQTATREVDLEGIRLSLLIIPSRFGSKKVTSPH